MHWHQIELGVTTQDESDTVEQPTFYSADIRCGVDVLTGRGLTPEAAIGSALLRVHDLHRSGRMAAQDAPAPSGIHVEMGTNAAADTGANLQHFTVGV